MKLFTSRDDMEQVPRIGVLKTFTRRIKSLAKPPATAGPSESLPKTWWAQCSTVIGLHPRDDEWLSGNRMNGVWYGTAEDAAAHQAAMDVVPFGEYEAMAVSPWQAVGSTLRTSA